MPDYQYDLVVIGSGPAGQKAAIAASKLGKRTAIIDRRERIGGVSLHTGTIPSKTIREAIMNLTGFRERSFYGKDYRVKDKISVADLAIRVQAVLNRELQVVRTQIQNNNIAVVEGVGSFKDDHSIEVKNGSDAKTVTSQFILVACGTRPAHNPLINVDAARIFDSDQLGGFGEIPREIIVVGAGVIGLEYASMFSALGTRVTIVEQRPTVLDFVDREIIDCLLYHLRRREAILRFGEKVTSVSINEKGRVITQLESGKTIQGDALLYTVGRQANSDLLNLPAAGLNADS
ncbi:MAG TPA: FAD-dependent oxidoreductase, partial [Acidobacteriota bacterium]|nr:FAD-dependent oxidoreductase [Acidobacteriota bacterium]